VRAARPTTSSLSLAPPSPPLPQVRFARDRHPTALDDGRQLFFSNAPASASEGELQALFAAHGAAVESLMLVRDTDTRESKVGGAPWAVGVPLLSSEQRQEACLPACLLACLLALLACLLAAALRVPDSPSPSTLAPQGCGLVTMASRHDAVTAIEALDGKATLVS